MALVVKGCPQGVVNWELRRNADSGSLPQASEMRITGSILSSVQWDEKIVLPCPVTRWIKFTLSSVKHVTVALQREHVSESLQGCFPRLLNPSPGSNSVGRRRALEFAFLTCLQVRMLLKAATMLINPVLEKPSLCDMGKYGKQGVPFCLGKHVPSKVALGQKPGWAGVEEKKGGQGG